MKTGFWYHERCFWHSGGNYAFMLPVGGYVQPMAAGGIPENPETKRRLKNLLELSGLAAELDMVIGRDATDEELVRVHPPHLLAEMRRLSLLGGGEIGQRSPFGPDGFQSAALASGLAIEAVRSVLNGHHANAYALSRPPGHHSLPDMPMGFCQFANVAVAVEAALADRLATRIAVVDWDVHHGNGTEAIFYDRDDVLTISIHQENCYPVDSGGVDRRGSGRGHGFNINVPLLPGSGHEAYIYAFERIVQPALKRYRPDAIVVACGFDASAVDPLARMQCSAETFRQLTRAVKRVAHEICGGKLILVHEGGYSEAHVPFCGHAVLEELSGSSIRVPDPLHDMIIGQQPNERQRRLQMELIDEMACPDR